MGDTKTTIEVRLGSERLGPHRKGLFLLASEQAGYFTTAQAATYGTSPALLSALASSGTMIHVRRGLYRIGDFPSSPREEVVAAWLAVGKDSAVVSHETALDLWDLTDLIPDAVHLTVPRSRRHLPDLPGVRIHTTTRPLSPDEIRVAEWSLRVTTPQRTLLDVASAGAEPSQVILGIQQAQARGWLDEAAFHAAAHQRGQRVSALVDRALTTDDYLAAAAPRDSGHPRLAIGGHDAIGTSRVLIVDRATWPLVTPGSTRD